MLVVVVELILHLVVGQVGVQLFVLFSVGLARNLDDLLLILRNYCIQLIANVLAICCINITNARSFLMQMRLRLWVVMVHKLIDFIR